MKQIANRGSQAAVSLKKKRSPQVNLPVFQGTMPTATFGACFNASVKKYGCRNYFVDLAEGMCMSCWDDGRKAGRRKDGRGRKRKEVHPALAEALARVRGEFIGSS